MRANVVCLRPEADFVRVNALPPPTLAVNYRALGDEDVPKLMREARALIIPAVGDKLAPSLFEKSSLCRLRALASTDSIWTP